MDMTNSVQRYAGLMSGTSLDAIDVVIAEFETGSTQLLATHTHAFPETLRERLTRLINTPAGIALDELGRLHRELGELYAAALATTLQQHQLTPADIAAVGCHGQTVRHAPAGAAGFSLQLGCTATLAARSGVAAVGDFRNADIALGGQGAPLVPAFHQFMFSGGEQTRVIVNIGGIANISILRADGTVSGCDTGPGNTLLDNACARGKGTRYDDAGHWAQSGQVNDPLLQRLLADPYFAKTGPKSTGREYFHWAWLQAQLEPKTAIDANLQATLAELTARSIAVSAQAQSASAALYVCGGGALNRDLLQRLTRLLPSPAYSVDTTAALGLAPQWVEATAFAWLARARLLGQAGNIAAATGASRAAVLGALHQP